MSGNYNVVMEASFPLNDKKEHLTTIMFQLDCLDSNSSLGQKGNGKSGVSAGRSQCG